MNRTDTKKLIEVMQSYVSGADIEHRPIAHEGNLTWSQSLPSWDIHQLEYRVALKPPADIYVGVDMVNNNFTTPSTMPNSIFTHGNENLKLCHYRLVE